MKEISVFQQFNIIVAAYSFEKIAEIIKSDKFKNQVIDLRSLLSNNQLKEYTARKKSLPAFTPSGKFDGGRKPEFLKEYLRIIILDLDKLDNVQEVKQKAEACPYTYSCFTSPSGTGLKILVRTNNSVAKHREAFLQVQDYYQSKLGISIDPSGKDVTRLCFFSWDTELYLNNESETFNIAVNMDTKNDTEKLIEQINSKRIDITGSYDEWLKIGFAIESEFGISGREYYHAISKYNPDYNTETCNDQYNKCLKNNNTGISIKTLFHIAKQHGIVVKSKTPKASINNKQNTDTKRETANKFIITERYLSRSYDIRYNVVSNKFEYRNLNDDKYKELNENNLFVKLQKDNINISLNNLVALLKSDFVNEFNPFVAYFRSLPEWDGETDHIGNLVSYLKSPDEERLIRHFRKWLVRVVKTAIDDFYYNKQAFVLVSNKQNSGKSTFCRFLCPPMLNEYIVENIGTDKDSLVAITENFLINLDELSTAEKAEINAFKSMFSKDKIKARLTYDKRASVHVRRASFIGSTDRWEFLTDENGSVRWLCFDITYIDWNYSKEVKIDFVYAQAYHLLTRTKFNYELTAEEIEENDRINKRYQVSSPERDLIQKFYKPATKEKGIFVTATDIIEFISMRSTLKINAVQVGKELKYLGYQRVARFVDGNAKYGYIVEQILQKNEK